MCHRATSALASVERDPTFWTEKFKSFLRGFEFVPAGRTVANAGSANVRLSNCVVLHMEDSIHSIFHICCRECIIMIFLEFPSGYILQNTAMFNMQPYCSIPKEEPQWKSNQAHIQLIE
jgi:hypothetical protein